MLFLELPEDDLIHSNSQLDSFGHTQCTCQIKWFNGLIQSIAYRTELYSWVNLKRGSIHLIFPGVFHPEIICKV